MPGEYLAHASNIGDLVLFSSYLDGSGKLNDPKSDHVVLAGAVFYADDVPAFGPAWADCLRLHSKKAKRPIARYFHAKDAFRCQEEFKHWKIEQVRELAAELAQLTRERCYNLICAPANKSRFKALPNEFQKKLQGPNELSFEICVNEVLQELGENDQIHI
jgi:hypothetical protein